MKRFTQTALVAAACIASAAPALAAPKQCNIVGAFKDSLGTTGRFTTQKKGTATNTAICAKSYNLTVTKLNTKVVDIKGSVPGGSCGALTGSFTFQNGGCITASGSITIVGLGTFADTVTHTGPVANRPPADISAFTSGLK